MFVMWSSKSKEKGKRKKEKVGTLRVLHRGLPMSLGSRIVPLFCLFTFAFLLSSCRRDMQDQPKAIAYRESTFFKDGVSSRPPVEGTVPRGYLRADREFYFGKKSGYRTGSGSDRVIDSTGQQPGANPSAATMFPDDVENFPFPITKDVLERGQERYQIFCSSCHGLTGYGDGMVARRGFNKPAPASFHQDKLRQAPVGHFFDVITNGWGAMPSHASQIPVEDRWKIIAYIRALQLSQTPPGGNPTVREGASTSPKGPQK
jgi:mono/diheme cytochrome c family protein